MGRGKGLQGQETESTMREYRTFLVKASQKESEAYDKAVMTLSGGALGISLTFIHSIVPTPRSDTVYLLAIGWGFLATSVVAILISKLTSQWALRKAIRQVDERTIHQERPGAAFSAWTVFLNVAAGTAFLLGVVFLAWFTIVNLLLGEERRSLMSPDFLTKFTP